MSDETPTTVTDRDVYLVYEHRRGVGKDDALQMVFEDDAKTLREVIDYYTRLSASDSQILEGEFHAANPGRKYMNPGDFYLVKRHGVGISHGLAPE